MDGTLMHLGSMQIQQCNDSSILYAFRYLILEFQYNFDQIDFLLDRILGNYYFISGIFSSHMKSMEALGKTCVSGLKNKQTK